MTPQCPFTEQLSVYHDGELDDVSRRGLEAHLPNCPECRGQLAQWDRLSQVIGSCAKPRPTVQEIARIHQAATQVPDGNEMGKATPRWISFGGGGVGADYLRGLADGVSRGQPNKSRRRRGNRRNGN